MTGFSARLSFSGATAHTPRLSALQFRPRWKVVLSSVRALTPGREGIKPAPIVNTGTRKMNVNERDLLLTRFIELTSIRSPRISVFSKASTSNGDTKWLNPSCSWL